jgi:hypothetical protein
MDRALARNAHERAPPPVICVVCIPDSLYGTERGRPLAGFFPCFPQVLGVVFHRPCNLLCILSTSLTAMQGSRCFVSPSPQTPSYSRRHTSRVETPDGVWVYWRCNGRDEVSPVRDLSAGGLLIAAPSPRPVDTKARLDFLVQEGQIRAEAVVRHIEPGNRLGFKFTAVIEQDSPHLAALLTRLRSLSRSRAKP